MALSREMSAEQAFEVVQTLLDQPENRFPLTFNSDLPRNPGIVSHRHTKPVGSKERRAMGLA